MLFESSLQGFSLLWTGFYLISASFVSLILYMTYHLYLIPKVRMQFYEKQGIPCYYFPVVGSFKDTEENVIKFGDSHFKNKRRARDTPSRASCSNWGSSATISLYDPVLIKEFYRNNDNYIKDPSFLSLFSSILGKGLITSEGSQWKNQRKILSSSFHFEFLKSILPNIQATTAEHLNGLKNTSMENISVMDEFQDITGQVVGQIFFGEQLNQQKFEGRSLTIGLADLIIQIAQLNASPERLILGPALIQKGIFPKHRRLMQRIKGFRKACSDIVDARKAKRAVETQKKEASDMLDMLLDYQGEGKMDGEEIIDQFVSFFLAGMDTTGHLATIALYFLHKHPEYKVKMVDEIKQHYPFGQVPSIDDLNKLEFMTAFLKECFRVLTPVPGIFPRKALKDHSIKDINIKKGDVILLDFFYNHYDPKNFDNVEDFNPNRWLDKTKSVDAYAFTPFSAGPRNCIGQHLSLIEARIILSEFLLRYEFKLRDNYELKMSSKFLYEPIEDIKVKLTPIA